MTDKERTLRAKSERGRKKKTILVTYTFLTYSLFECVAVYEMLTQSLVHSKFNVIESWLLLLVLTPYV
jgi:nitrate reductase NapE component